MKFFVDQISYYVQGVLVLQQFIWSFPKLFSFALGIINELQTITYLNNYTKEDQASLTSEITIFRQISRPNTLITQPQIACNVILGFLIIFITLGVCFIQVVKKRSSDILIGLQNAYNESIVIKSLLIFINISTNFTLYGFGIIFIEIDLLTLASNLDNYYITIVNSIQIIAFAWMIFFFVEMFSYNWALDFSKEHLIINETPLTKVRIIFKMVQIVISIFLSQGKLYMILQSFLTLLTCSIQLYLIQKMKLYLYGYYYQIILAINCLSIILALQYFLMEIFVNHDLRFLWIVLAILPFEYCKLRMKQDCKMHFINIKHSNIEDCNSVLFSIIKSQQQNRINFQEKLIYIMYLHIHSNQCQNVLCDCKVSIKEDQVLYQTVHALFFTDLQHKYEYEINTTSFICSQEQIVFSYLQLLFFKRKHLFVFQLFQVVFSKLSSYNSNKANQISISKEYGINKNVFRIKSLHRITILQVAQNLVTLDIYQLLSNQKQFILPKSQRIHSVMTEILQQQQFQAKMKSELQHIIATKISFLEKMDSQISIADLNKLAQETIVATLEGLKFFTYLSKKFQSNYLYKNQDNKYQSLLIFYYVEILNDIIGASELTQYQEKIKLTSISSYLILLDNFMRSISQFWLMLAIANMWRQQITLLVKNFEKLIPDFISDIHPALIEGFISGKENKYYVQLNDSFVLTSPILINRIELVMDTNSISMGMIELTIFMRNKVENQYSIFLDDQYCIKNIEKPLFCNILHVESNYAEYFAGFHISHIFPNYLEFVSNNNPEFFHQIFNFINLNKIHEGSTNQSSSNSIIDNTLFLEYWKNPNYLKQYNCQLRFCHHSPQDLGKFYEIILFGLKKISNDIEAIKSKPHSIESKNKRATINESVSIDFPLEIEAEVLLDTIQLPQNLKSDRDIALTQREYLLSPASPISEGNVYQKDYSENDNYQKKQWQVNTETQGSFIQAFQQSSYYHQFSLINRLIKVNKAPACLMKMKLLIVCFGITVVIGIGLVTFYINQILQEIDRLHYFSYDFQLLSMKKDIFYPILSFQLIRYAILNYQQEYTQGIISKEEYDDLLIYPISKLYNSYDQLKRRIYNFIFRKLFAFNILQSEDEGQEKSLDLRNSLITLLNYQYDIQNAYILNGKADYGSPYFYYSNKNYDELLNSFSEANFFILSQFLDRSKIGSSKFLTITLIIILLLAIIQLMISYQSYQFYDLIYTLQNLFMNIDQYSVNLEIKRLNLFTEAVDANFVFFEKYQIDVVEKDKVLKEIEKISKDHVRRKKRVNLSLFNYKEIGVKLLNLIAVVIALIVMLMSVNQFYHQLENTAIFYKTLTDINIETLILYSSREVLYHKTIYQFMNQTDFDYYYLIARESLEHITKYVEVFSSLTYSDYILNTQFESIINVFNKGNMCDILIVISYFTQEMDASNIICHRTLQGILEQGFQASLVYIKNSIQVEIGSTNFTQRNTYPILELEGVLLLSSGMQHLIAQYYFFLLSYNQQMEIILNIVAIVSLIFSIFFGIFLILYATKIETHKYMNSITFVYLTPLSTTISDESFMRDIRSLLIHNQLL